MAEIRVKENRAEYSTQRICSLLRVTKQTLSNWEREGCPKAARGWWDLEAVLEWRGMLGETGSRTPEKLSEMSMQHRKLAAEVEWKEAQGDYARLREAITRGDYIKRSVVIEDYRRFFVVFKRFAMALPRMLAGMISSAVDPAEARRLEKDLTAQVTKQLSQFVLSARDEDA